ncbi:hypothetical protein OCU04_000113 [Sclerotinia nivalis]|uniref:Phosphoglycerate mutase family protein n=1 Tax=Sclerotinia nivalis TaxID=352851 RepID=A0A9X0AYV0_9HELO|nr:hypothetical protein OCU04_000113 [Sclerotinia nivalis]
MGFWFRKSSSSPHSSQSRSRNTISPKTSLAKSESASPPPPMPSQKSESKSKLTDRPTDRLKSTDRPKPKPRKGRIIIIHFVRHAEAYNNIRPSHSHSHSPTLRNDPPLTPHGKSQCHTLHTKLSHLNPTYILCSPLLRTLQTAFLGLSLETYSNSKTKTKRKIKIIADPELREFGSGPSCTGTELGVLRRYKGMGHVDFMRVEEWERERGRSWEINMEKDGGYVIEGYRGKRKWRWRRSREQKERGERVKRDLWGLGDEARGMDEDGRRKGRRGRDIEILVFSHGEFLRGLTGDYWHNADIISRTIIKTPKGYEFIDPPSRFAYH